MDLASIAGILIAVMAILGGQVLEGGHPGSIMQVTAFLIVFGGTAGACLVNFPMRDFVRGVVMAKHVFTERKVDLKATLDE
ncbi:MAG TPA: motility-associated protein, partial [Planctomycetota bacterium]|nr:motility-associated protein [Planctomycetota bacterium]